MPLFGRLESPSKCWLHCLETSKWDLLVVFFKAIPSTKIVFGCLSQEKHMQKGFHKARNVRLYPLFGIYSISCHNREYHPCKELTQSIFSYIYGRKTGGSIDVIPAKKKNTKEPSNQGLASYFFVMESSVRRFISSLGSIPTGSSLFEAYVAISTSVMLLQTATNQIIPPHLRSYIFARLKSYFFRAAAISSHVTVNIPQLWENWGRNELFDAVKEYLPSKISTDNKNLVLGKSEGDEKIAVRIKDGESIVDVFDGTKLTWKYMQQEDQRETARPSVRTRGLHNRGQPDTYSEKRPVYTLTFDERYREKVMDSYLPHILGKHKDIKESEKVLKHYTRPSGSWQASELKHPATFEKLAMEPDLKKAILDDLGRFLKRRKFYERVGKAWKRGYLLYGPPGTGKTSLIAAMAKFLKFDIYDLELTSVSSNAALMTALRTMSNRSILAVEDIDCSREVWNRLEEGGDPSVNPNLNKLTLSGILNCFDGLWTSGGEERILVFTTNHKDQLDPALLRPGRMDMHINLSFCTGNAFRILSSNYLEVQSHPLFEPIERLLGEIQVTPAVVAEELMRSEDADVVLSGLVEFLERKQMEGDGKV